MVLPTHPVLRRPAGATDDDIAWVSRDREEELRDVVHHSRPCRERRGHPARAHRNRLSPAVAVSLSVSTSSDRGSGAVSSRGRAAAGGRTLCGAPGRCLTFARTGGTRESAIELLLGVRPGSDQGQTGVRPGSDSASVSPRSTKPCASGAPPVRPTPSSAKSLPSSPTASAAAARPRPRPAPRRPRPGCAPCCCRSGVPATVRADPHHPRLSAAARADAR